MGKHTLSSYDSCSSLGKVKPGANAHTLRKQIAMKDRAYTSMIKTHDANAQKPTHAPASSIRDCRSSAPSRPTQQRESSLSSPSAAHMDITLALAASNKPPDHSTRTQMRDKNKPNKTYKTRPVGDRTQKQ